MLLDVIHDAVSEDQIPLDNRHARNKMLIKNKYHESVSSTSYNKSFSHSQTFERSLSFKFEHTQLVAEPHCVMSGNFLAVVPNESLPSLRDKFKDNWPDHILAFTFIKKTIDFRSSNPEIDDELKILCLNGEWMNGTFVAVLVSASHFNVLSFNFDTLSSERKIFSSHLSSPILRISRELSSCLTILRSECSCA